MEPNNCVTGTVLVYHRLNTFIEYITLLQTKFIYFT